MRAYVRVCVRVCVRAFVLYSYESVRVCARVVCAHMSASARVHVSIYGACLKLCVHVFKCVRACVCACGWVWLHGLVCVFVCEGVRQ